ncbi:hypothetical protein PG997_003105, partial [Apiospora hydei]
PGALTWLLLCVGFWPLMAYASCTPYPITVPIGNVSLPNKQIARGVEIQVGDPPQPFAFMPQWPLNNTFLYGPNGQCPSNEYHSVMSCTTKRGGAYDAFASSTRKQVDPATYPIDSAPYPQMSYVSESLRFNDNVSLGNFPVGVALNDWGAQGYHPTVAFGLGTNSTLLKTLKRSSKILSNTWGLFWGRNGGTTSSQLNGSIVFGGYDRAKVSGQKYVQAMSKNAGCSSRLVATISDMILNFPNGTNASIFPSSQSTALAACIVPDYPTLLTLPLDPYVNTFQRMTGMNNDLERSLGLNFFSIKYTRASSANNVNSYGGDLTIQLQSGLSVRVPNDQLVVPDVIIVRPTGALVVNGSAPDLVINSIQDVNANDLPQLGRQFLTAAYLMVNMDADQFTLWSANPTSDQDLVAVDTSNQEVTEYCGTGQSSLNNSGDGPESGSDPSSTATGSSASSRTRLIAGAVAGSIGGVLLIVSTTVYILGRRKRINKERRVSGRNPIQPAMPPYYGEAPPYSSPPQKSWQQQYKAELPGDEAIYEEQRRNQTFPPSASHHRYELGG